MVSHRLAMVLTWRVGLLLMFILPNLAESQAAACGDVTDCSVQGKFQCVVRKATNIACDQNEKSLDDRPGPPSSMTAEVTHVESGKSRVKVTLGTPTMGLTKLRGFYIKAYGTGRDTLNLQHCWFMNITNTDWNRSTDLNNPIEVSFDCLSLEVGEFYLRGQSYPKAVGEGNSKSALISSSNPPISGGLGFDWQPSISASVTNSNDHNFNPRRATVSVWFTVPSGDAVLNRYRVRVFNKDVIFTSGQGEVEDVDLCHSNAQIKVTLIKYYKDDNSCLPCVAKQFSCRCPSREFNMANILENRSALCPDEGTDDTQVLRWPTGSITSEESTVLKTAPSPTTAQPFESSPSEKSTILKTLTPPSTTVHVRASEIKTELHVSPTQTQHTSYNNSSTGEGTENMKNVAMIPSNGNENWTKIFLVVLVGLLTLVLVILSLVYMIRRKYPGLLSRCFPGTSDLSTLMKYDMLKQKVCRSKKRILLVAFRSNHEQVQQVIKNFIDVMEHSQCDVRYHEWKLKEIHTSSSSYDWFKRETTSADWVVFVHSEEAFNEWAGIEHLRDVTSSVSSSAARVLTDPQSQHVRKILNIRFRYTVEKFFIEKLAKDEARYCITNDLWRLIERIHKLESRAYDWSDFCRSLPNGSFGKLDQSVYDAEKHLHELQATSYTEGIMKLSPLLRYNHTLHRPKCISDLDSDNITDNFRQLNEEFSNNCSEVSHQPSCMDTQSSFNVIPPDSLSNVQSVALKDGFDEDYSFDNVILGDSLTILHNGDNDSEFCDSGISGLSDNLPVIDPGTLFSSDA